MKDTSLHDRLIRAADEFPLIDAVMVYRPDLRDEHADELAKVRSVDPAIFRDETPPGTLPLEEIRKMTWRGLSITVPAGSSCGLRLHREEWWGLIYSPATSDFRARRLLDTLCGDAAETLLKISCKQSDRLPQWVKHLAERAQEKVVQGWAMLDGKPWLPCWRPAQESDRWWVVSLKNILSLSALAVRDLMHGEQADDEGAATSIPRSALPELKPVHRAELEIIRKHNGITGKELLAELNKVGFMVEKGTFDRHHVPILKAHGVRNDRARGGYYLGD